jgi:hypothetical protein|tara:strand:- start:1103 stop:1279 length:177 start_codon:yes stop_codon:yes gene_type:complete
MGDNQQLLDESAQLDVNDSLVYGSQDANYANNQISEFELERLESFSPELEYMMDIEHL